MRKWLEAKQIKGKFYISSADFSNVVKEYSDKIAELEEENNNLKNELMEDMKTESKLNEEIRSLKSELSKFRDSFKKYRDYEKEELAESCYDFARENDKLKEENRKLKMSEKRYKNQYDFDEECLRKLEEENKKLREEIGKLVKDGK